MMRNILWLAGAYVLMAIEALWLMFLWAWLVWGWV